VRSLEGAEIRIGNHSDFLANPIAGHISTNQRQALPRAHIGRYVTIQILHRFEELLLCEVEILEDWQIDPYKPTGKIYLFFKILVFFRKFRFFLHFFRNFFFEILQTSGNIKFRR